MSITSGSGRQRRRQAGNGGGSIHRRPVGGGGSGGRRAAAHRMNPTKKLRRNGHGTVVQPDAATCARQGDALQLYVTTKLRLLVSHALKLCRGEKV